MQARSDWSKWAESLRRLKLDGFAAWLLEAGGPLTILGAQAVYMSQPFIGGKNMDSLAHMLEEEIYTSFRPLFTRRESSMALAGFACFCSRFLWPSRFGASRLVCYVP